MARHFHIIRKLDDRDSETVARLAEQIIRAAKRPGWAPVEDITQAEVLVSIGGDGTMLYGMAKSAELGIPVFGFNIGKIGYLAEFQPEEIEQVMGALAMGELTQETRTMIREEVSGALAINEFSIVPVRSRDTLKYDFFVNGVNSGRHHANGLLVSTPTGSTAYALSAGGAVLSPASGVFQITPVAAMSLTSRSVVVNDGFRIDVRVHQRKNVMYNLVADGQVVLEFGGIDEVKTLSFLRAEEKATLLHGPSWNFFSVLQEKLLWNRMV